MRTFLTIILALTVLAACESESIEPLGSTATTSTTRARAVDRPTTTSTTTAAPAPTTTQPPRSSEDEHSSCSEDRLDAAALQQSVDDGHQPWRLDPEMVAGAGAACFFGGPAAAIEPAGGNRYVATSAATGEHAIVEVTQPLGPGTVWLVSDVTDA